MKEIEGSFMEREMKIAQWTQKAKILFSTIFEENNTPQRASVAFREPNKDILRNKRWSWTFFFCCLREGCFPIKVGKGGFTVGEGFGSSSQDPGIQPSLSIFKRLKSFDGFQSSLQMRVGGFDHVVCSWNTRDGLIRKKFFTPAINIEHDGL